MRNFLFKSALCCMLAAVFCGCHPDNGGVGDFSLSVKSVGPDYVELDVTAPSSVEMAYMITTEPSAVSPAVLFMTGDTLTVNPGDVVRLGENLQAETDYRLYAAAKLDAQNYSNVVTLEFKTVDYDFERLLSVVDTRYDGFRVRITVPENVKEAGNAIRYSTIDLATYNMLMGTNGTESNHTLHSIIFNGDRHGNYTKGDTTILRDNSNILPDFNGVPVDGVEFLHNPITPGEPTVFLAGEVRWGSDEEMGEITGLRYGVQDSSYQVALYDKRTIDPLFDWSNTDRDDWTGSGWTGAFQKLVFNAKAPEPTDKTVHIEIPEDEITVTDAKVYFTMDEGITRYFYLILDDATYNGVIDQFLGLKGAEQEEIDKAFQWFLTSWVAQDQFLFGAVTENIEVSAATDFPLTGGGTYHVLCTAMVDKDSQYNEDGELVGGDGAYQSYIHKTFSTKPKTKKAPVIEITPVEPVNTYEATFNIKTGGDADNKLVGAYFAANYSREFELLLNSGYTYELIVGENESGNYTFNSDQIRQINSPEGLTLRFPALDGETIRLAVYGCNDEYTFNTFNENKEGLSWADCDVPMATDLIKVTPINSNLYEALAGDWTATATAKINETDEDGNKVSRNQKLTSKVTISRSIPNIPAEMPDEVYDAYEKVTKLDREEVEAMYEDLITLSKRFDRSRIEDQNRLLCTGFLDYDYFENGRMTYKSPYDLFKDLEYNSVDVPQLVYDFGPKWFLQVHADGTVTVPFSTAYLPPMHSWPGYPFYVGGVPAEGAAFLDGENAKPEDLPGFPVEISEDLNTITIKPIVRKDVKYYMNAIGVASGSYELISTINTEIVLTRGWNGSSTNPGSKAAAADITPSKVNCVAAPAKAAVYKSITKLEPAPLKTYKVDENPHIVTMDMLDSTRERILEKYNLK